MGYASQRAETGTKGRGIFMVTLISTPSTCRNSTRWYNKEHLPELLSVPAFSQRPLRGGQGCPQYWHAMNWESVAVMQTPALPTGRERRGDRKSRRP